MSVVAKSSVLGESSTYNILAPTGPAKPVKSKGSAKKSKRTKSKKVDKKIEKVVSALFSDENVPSGDFADVKVASDSFPTMAAIATEEANEEGLDDSIVSDAVSYSVDVPKVIVSEPTFSLSSPRRHSAHNILRSPTQRSVAATTPRRNSACETPTREVTLASSVAVEPRQGAPTPIAMRNTPRRVKLMGAASKFHELSASFASQALPVGTTPEKPHRIGGGFTSPSLLSPPSEIPASKAAQERVNRRASNTKTKTTADVASSIETDSITNASRFLSPLPEARQFLANTFSTGAFLGPEIVTSDIYTPNAADAERIYNSVTAPFYKFHEAASGAKAELMVPPMMPFSPQTVLRGAGITAPLFSPCDMTNSATEDVVLVDIAAENAFAQRYVFAASIESAEVVGSLFDRHTVYNIKTTVLLGQTVVSSSVTQRRYRDFLRFYKFVGKDIGEATTPEAHLQYALRACLQRASMPPKVSFMPTRQSVVDSRRAVFSDMLRRIACVCSGVRNISSVPEVVRAFLEL